jgi:hypothetical protein
MPGGFTRFPPMAGNQQSSWCGQFEKLEGEQAVRTKVRLPVSKKDLAPLPNNS